MKIVLIGTGRVAEHITRRLYGSDVEIVQVYGRNMARATTIAVLSGCSCIASDAIDTLIRDADGYIIAINDNALPEIVATLSAVLPATARIVHTSGGIASSVFEPFFENYGVFYPLQSFSAQTIPNWERIPIGIMTKQPDTFAFWAEFASRLSLHIYSIDDAQRVTLHIAAVFANNFTNHLYTIAAHILAQQALPFELLQPLILETALKVQNYAPLLVQTGPAARGDSDTIARHLAYLQQHAPANTDIYTILTKDIQKKD